MYSYTRIIMTYYSAMVSKIVNLHMDCYVLFSVYFYSATQLKRRCPTYTSQGIQHAR